MNGNKTNINWEITTYEKLLYEAINKFDKKTNG